MLVLAIMLLMYLTYLICNKFSAELKLWYETNKILLGVMSALLLLFGGVIYYMAFRRKFEFGDIVDLVDVFSDRIFEYFSAKETKSVLREINDCEKELEGLKEEMSAADITRNPHK
jgi:hypothetical protein